jgi:hypothetical protein
MQRVHYFSRMVFSILKGTPCGRENARRWRRSVLL